MNHLLVNRLFFLNGCVEECRLKESGMEVNSLQFALVDHSLRLETRLLPESVYFFERFILERVIPF